MDIEESTGRVLKFAELASMLNLGVDDVEEWAISAINNDIIDGRIDQLKEEIIIKTHRLRQMNAEEWQKVKAKVVIWKQRFEAIHNVLSHQPSI